MHWTKATEMAVVSGTVAEPEIIKANYKVGLPVFPQPQTTRVQRGAGWPAGDFSESYATVSN